jgi:hypothetical protein
MDLKKLAQGAGSGGGDDGNNTLQTADGVYEIAANEVTLLTTGPDHGPEGPHIITLLASGKKEGGFSDGRVDVRGSKGVRITSGPAIPPDVPTTSESTNGVEIITSGTQKILLQVGAAPTPPAPPKIEMQIMAIIIDAGTGIIRITTTSGSISLQAGPSSIVLAPEGITINGPMVNIN